MSLCTFAGLNLACTEEPRTAYSSPGVASPVLCRGEGLPPLTSWQCCSSFFATSVLCWLMVILCTRSLGFFSTKLLSRQSALRLLKCLGVGICIYEGIGSLLASFLWSLLLCLPEIPLPHTSEGFYVVYFLKTLSCVNQIQWWANQNSRGIQILINRN